MDINETNLKMISRHPWELSRTKCVADSFKRFFNNDEIKSPKRYINIGGG